MSQSRQVTIQPVDGANWRAVAQVQVGETQRDFVMPTTYYLALCHYSEVGWQPLAILLDEEVIGFLMWAVDPADGACWLGGIQIDQRYQGLGYGRQAVNIALRWLNATHGFEQFALSYQPANKVARHLYQQVGFFEGDEWEDDEVVARLTFVAQVPRS